MTQLAYAEFCTLVGSLSETLSTREVIDKIRTEHTKQLSAITPKIVENAIINIRRNVLRRKAQLIVDGYGDLFEKYDLPASVPKLGTRNSRRVPPGNLTKKELRLLIEKDKGRPLKKEKRLSELEKVYEDIDGFCSDNETVETGLKRRKKV